MFEWMEISTRKNLWTGPLLQIYTLFLWCSMWSAPKTADTATSIFYKPLNTFHDSEYD